MILTKTFLRNQAMSRKIFEYSSTTIFKENQQISEIRHSSTGKKFDLFISHSSLDKQLVLTLVDLFNDAGYSVYVDWLYDKQLDRSLVTQETAQTIRCRVIQSSGLSYISTQNATSSKWCPWELGIADGTSKGRVCICPVLDYESKTFVGQEYLGLYPYLVYEKTDNTGKYNFWVHDCNNTNNYVVLSAWLKGMEPISH